MNFVVNRVRPWLIVVFLVFGLSVSDTSGQVNLPDQRVTLYSYFKYRDWSRAYFSFERGVRGAPSNKDESDSFDVLYGNLRVGNDADWFTVYWQSHHRSRILDLGEKQWAQLRQLPAFPISRPQPLDPDKALPGTVDASAGTKKVAPYDQFVRIRSGHIYLLHVKSKRKNFYVLFRVEDLVPGDSCTFSWKRIPPPETDLEK